MLSIYLSPLLPSLWPALTLHMLAEDPLLTDSACGRPYQGLEECLAAHARDFRKCQTEVKALRSCYEAFQAARRGSVA